jgi:hypothetical protein
MLNRKSNYDNPQLLTSINNPCAQDMHRTTYKQERKHTEKTEARNEKSLVKQGFLKDGTRGRTRTATPEGGGF